MLSHRPLVRLFVACAIAAGVGMPIARADDIDIYSIPNTEGLRPNILIILDNSANWSASISTPLCDAVGASVRASSPNKEEGTKMGAQKCALYKVINTMSVADLSEYNLAIMMFNESPDSAGYPRQAFVNITTAAQKTALLNMIAGIGINADKTNNASTAEAFYEAWLYFSSNQVRYGNRTATKHDTAAFSDSSKSRYAGPGVGCARNHIIYLANGAPSDNNNTAFELLQRINPIAARTRIPVAENVGSSDEANWADEFAAFFNRGADLSTANEGAQNITTHTIAVTGASSDGNYPNFVRWIATEGGGVYQAASNSNAIITALNNVLNQIRSANSVFSSASLPVSANTQGTYLNQVFIGMFRPDGNALPRWLGNLKQYQFIYDAQRDQLQLADVNGVPAVSATSGFITPSATSFWTQPSSFWIKQETSSSGRYSRSDAPDGELVEKGGIAQWLRTRYWESRADRPIYTCVGGGCDGGGSGRDLAYSGSSYTFQTDNSNLTAAMFGVATTTQRDLVIRWVRGRENVTSTDVANQTVARDQLGQAPDGVTVRPSIHGDVLHSRPIALNYGGTRGVVVYYGSNDGMLHAINGNQTGTGAGTEMWSFVAPDHYAAFNRLRENLPQVRYPSTPSTDPTARSRDYFFDGPIGAYQNTSTGEAIIVPAMRRGGRALFAFNVADPDRPRLLWRVGSDMTNYTSLGQTWSMPRIVMVQGRADPIIIMGGGYDNTAEDVSPAGSTTKGRGVYVMNMRTGERLAWLPTDYSVPADVAVLDSDGDGYVDRAYVLDVRGQVYRLDIEGPTGEIRDPSAWVITKIAAMNDGTGGLDGTRKAFFAPDLIITRNYTALLFGTGDREKPLSMVSNDRFYLLKDSKVTKGESLSVSLITDASLVATGSDGAGADAEGCAYSFATNGEKVINQPITFGGVTYFSTNRPLAPSAGSCSRAQNRSYAMPLVCRTPVHRDLVGDGLPPSPVVGYVDVGGGKLVPFVIGGPNDKNSAIEVNRATILIPGKRKRSYWFMDNRDR